MTRSRRVVLAALVASALLVPPAAARDEGSSGGVALVATFPNVVDERWIMDRGGTDMAYDGRYVYAAEQGATGGVRIVDTAGRRPRQVGYFRCGGIQNEVAVVRRGLLAIGYHQREFGCGSPDGGITLVDVSDPRRPRLLGSTEGPLPASDDPAADLRGVHTMTVYPGTDLIYASPGGRQAASSSVQTVVDVSDPRRPRVVASIDTGYGCHDFTFDIREDRRLGFCSGESQTQVWDVSAPLAPKVIGVIANPAHYFHHSAAVTPDGKHIVIGTETYANDCAGGPSGGLFIYDITLPQAPVALGYFGAKRGAAPVYSYPTDLEFDALCAPHLFGFVPGTRTLVSGNGSGGVNVVDWSDPTLPVEVAHYQPDDRDYWAAYWFGGRIYANGVQALDVLDLDLDAMRPTPGRPEYGAVPPDELPHRAPAPRLRYFCGPRDEG